ncbi:Belongs to the helicase [Dionaea muscipula]
MSEEMAALEANQNWDLVPLPSGKKAIGCKWVFVLKMNPDGSVSRLKARLVAKGYAQVYSIDYTETFSPVAKMASVRILISLTASHHWPLHQLEVKNAFFHRDLHEEMYVEQPPGFIAQGECGYVCRLKKFLYGLRQYPRAWFGRFSSVVLEFGLQRSEKDHSIFYRHSGEGCIFLVVYVDDIVITNSDSSGITSLKTFL